MKNYSNFFVWNHVKIFQLNCRRKSWKRCWNPRSEFDIKKLQQIFVWNHVKIFELNCRRKSWKRCWNPRSEFCTTTATVSTRSSSTTSSARPSLDSWTRSTDSRASRSGCRPPGCSNPLWVLHWTFHLHWKKKNKKKI